MKSSQIPKAIRDELQEELGQRPVRVTTKNVGAALSVHETDEVVRVNFNPKKIRSDKQLRTLVLSAKEGMNYTPRVS